MLGVIGGSGLYELAALRTERQASGETRFGSASQSPLIGRLGSAATEVAFLPRHGRDHAIAPHRINYKANIWALSEAGVNEIVAVNSVGSLSRDRVAGSIVVPDQLIDYTWGRESTFGSPEEPPRHIDFTYPFDPDLTARLREAADRNDVPIDVGGTYGCTQGPRFETAAEISRMIRDGCELVGMTAMPEAVLARELGIPYCAICSVGNLAAGLAGPDQELDHEEITAASATALESIVRLLEDLVA